MSEHDDDGARRWRRDDDDIQRAQRSLADAMQLARNRRADQDDVVVDMKEAERARIDLLVEELRPLFDEVGAEDERFDFGVSNGRRPRLWLDATTYVTMGNDRRTYRLVRDRLHGRSVLAETSQLDLMADATSTYIAERVLERRRALEGEWEELLARPGDVRTDDEPHPFLGPDAVAPDGSVKAHGNGDVPAYGEPQPVRVVPKRHWLMRLLIGALQFALGLALVAAIVVGLLYFFPDAFPD